MPPLASSTMQVPSSGLARTASPAEGGDRGRILAANDRLLSSLVLARTPEERDDAMETIVREHAHPLIELVLSKHRRSGDVLRPQDLEDIGATAVLRLVARLQRLTFDEEASIASLADFTAMLTHNALNDAMRRRFPERTRLKNRITYVLMRDARFRTWSGPEGTACALASASTIGRPMELDDDVDQSLRAQLDPDRLPDALAMILLRAGGPLRVNDVVRFLAEAWQIRDVEPQPIHDVAAGGLSPAARAEERNFLAVLWSEIGEMRDAQKAALLLNLRDSEGGNALALLLVVGIATFDQIAAALRMTAEELAAIWNDLPLADLVIAERLQLSRQQVINLRQAARARLGRRMSNR